jgi:hypothetical protein
MTDVVDVDDPGRPLSAQDKTTVMFCPKCHQETFDGVVTGGGEGHDPEWGKTGWVEGHGKCRHCDYVGEWSDSWP